MPGTIVDKDKDKEKIKLYCELLDVPLDASEDDIRVAYKRLALKWHPDRHQDDKEEAQAKFVEINDAYKALLDRCQRRGRHRHHDKKPSSPSPPPASGRETTGVPSTARSESGSTRSSGSTTSSGSSASSSSSSAPKSKVARDHKDRPPERKPDEPPDGDKPSSAKHSKQSKAEHPIFSYLPSRHDEWSSDEEDSKHTQNSSKRGRVLRKKARHFEEDGYEFIDLGSPLHPVGSPKSMGNTLNKDWIFPLPLSLDDLYHGASHHYRITRTLRSGKTQCVKIDLKITPGWKTGTRIRVPGVGNERRDGTFQDIVFVVEEEPHARFTRVDDDLYVAVQVPFAETRPARPYSRDLEGKMEALEEYVYVKGLNGEEFALEIPRSLVEGADGTRIVGAGMPVRKRGELVGKGDLVVRWDFIFPEVDKAERTRWQTLRKAMNWTLL